MDCSEVIIAKSVHSNRNTRPTVQCTAEKINEHVHRKDLAKASSPCVREGRQNLCFCIPLYPHFVPTAAGRTRPSMERQTVRWRQFKEMEHFHTDGLDLLWGKGWSSLEKTLGLKCCELLIPATVICVLCQTQTFSYSVQNHPSI